MSVASILSSYCEQLNALTVDVSGRKPCAGELLRLTIRSPSRTVSHFLPQRASRRPARTAHSPIRRGGLAALLGGPEGQIQLAAIAVRDAVTGVA